jgi:hypothetical protein
LAILLTIGLAGIVFAGTQGSDCPGDTTKVRLWENVEGDTSDGNDSYWQCVNESDLSSSDDDHTLAGTCKPNPIWSDDWNDCVSSFTIWIPNGWKFCVYRDQDYKVLLEDYIGPESGDRMDVGAGWNDKMTAFKWVSGNCPT